MMFGLVDASEYASVFLNSFTAIAAGAVGVCICENAFFDRRRSYVLFFAYFLLKAAFNAGIDAASMVGLESEGLRVANALFVSVSAVFSYLVIYWTWDAPLLKIGIGSLIIDLLAGTASQGAVIVSKLIMGKEPGADYWGPLGVDTLLTAVLMIAFVFAVSKLMGPIARWLRAHEFARPRIAQAAVVLLIAFLSSARLFEPRIAGRISIVSIAVVAVPVFAVIASLAVSRLRSERRQRRRLAQSREMLRAYTRAVEEQSAYLEEHRSELDELARNVARLSDGAVRTSLEDGLESIRALCEELRHGLYSDCPALDAVLCEYAGRFADAGMRLDLRAAPLGSNAAHLAHPVYVLLEWALGVMTEREGHRILHTGGCRCGMDAIEARAVLKLVRSGNQSVFRLDVPCGRKLRFPRRLLEDDIPRSKLAVVESRAPGGYAVLVMVEDDAL